MKILNLLTFDNDAVKIITSYIYIILCKNSSTPGLFKTKISQFLPSISIGSIISTFGMNLKELWTNVSSRSKIKVFLPLSLGFYFPINPTLSSFWLLDPKLREGTAAGV